MSPEISGPTMKFSAVDRSFVGVNAICPVPDGPELSVLERSHPSTSPACALSWSVNEYETSPPVVVSGMARLNRYPRE